MDEFNDDILTDSLILKAIDHSKVGLVITDPNKEDNPIVYVNRGFTDVTGYTYEESVGYNCRFLQGEDRNEQAIENMKRALAALEEYVLELENFKKDGTPFWNEIYIEPIYMENRLYFLGVQRDITRQKKYKDDLEKSERQVDRLSTPIVPITEKISVLPVVGDLSYERFEMIFHKISEAYGNIHYEKLILDLSGMDEYDEQVADSIMNLHHLLRLLGSELIVTGIRPELSMAFTSQNISLSYLRTAATVKEMLQELGIS
ncbi:PAS domain-containing protein [Marinococcus luteus]|uniref:PAS domain-containing protein n=1 Tax=Marinococcus luteus TaxID=1122204 RepID=UPI002ACCBE0E|nr:PAS domain-containing protein [Marinococcus luteus]MDZ5782794.1 PAS domain-containing protein [Marinococcus luteus]